MEDEARVQQSWVEFSILNNFLLLTAEKFIRKEKVQKRSNEIARMISLLFRAVGKFRLSLRKTRSKFARQRILKFLNVYVMRWVHKRRLINKAKAIKFLDTLQKQPILLSVLGKIESRILTVQRTFRFYLKKRKLLYAFNCKNWVDHELEILNQNKKDQMI